MRGIRDWGLGIRAGRKTPAPAGCAASTPISSNPQSPIPNRSARRRGVSLLEVLVSLFILAVGLMGVAALIPLGKLSLMATETSDRTGACGRAAIREVRIRGLLDPTTWAATPTSLVNPVVIDPLGMTLASPLGQLGGILDRVNIGGYDAGMAEQLCRWHDDLVFVRPEDITSGSIPPAGTRPLAQVGATATFAPV